MALTVIFLLELLNSPNPVTIIFNEIDIIGY
jgi:hypothetical protein